MTRAIGSAILIIGVIFGAVPGCADEGVGDPCTPEQEFDPTFNGFDEKEVNIESKSFQCRTRVCLVNHFRGRVSCVYGQTGEGTCKLPGTDENVTGNPKLPENRRGEVKPQCVDRTADKAVYCSCRCANINGATDDGAVYCECPDGFTCERLVTSIGQGNEGLTGSYCIKNNTQYDPAEACTKGDCNPGDPKTKCQ